VDIWTALALYIIAALGFDALLWRLTQDGSDKKKNRARRVFLASVVALGWPAAVIVGLFYLTEPGCKVVNLAIFGRTKLHDIP
jgi:hypothetical protein